MLSFTQFLTELTARQKQAIAQMRKSGMPHAAANAAKNWQHADAHFGGQYRDRRRRIRIGEDEAIPLVSEDENGFSLAAAKATRLAYKTNKPEDHIAAMKAHLAARGSEFAPQPPKGSSFQPNVDRWHHHDKQAKMHKAELSKVQEDELRETGHFVQQLHFAPAHEFPNLKDPSKLKPYGAT